jgi:hypothetical protein
MAVVDGTFTPGALTGPVSHIVFDGTKTIGGVAESFTDWTVNMVNTQLRNMADTDTLNLTARLVTPV